MAKKLERVFRDRRLTPEEVAGDQEVRRQVQKEFPSARRAFPSGPLSDTLKQAIRASGRSVEQIAGEAAVSQVVIVRFLAGEGDIHMTTADKLAEALGLKLAASS
jgi:hypothetical protein